jgi:hypothetical protein
VLTGERRKRDFNAINPARWGSNWLVNGTVKNNSSFAVKRYLIKISLYTFDDKHELWADYPGALEAGSD